MSRGFSTEMAPFRPMPEKGWLKRHRNPLIVPFRQAVTPLGESGTLGPVKNLPQQPVNGP
jgi:hypothetical protein